MDLLNPKTWFTKAYTAGNPADYALPSAQRRLKGESGSSTTTFSSPGDYDMMAAAMGVFTGSTMPGTMSLPRPWRLGYYALRERSWQAYYENEIAAGFTDRLRQFVINVGLRMQYEPSPLAGGMTPELKKFVEQDFAIFASSPAASLCGNKDLHTLADEAYLNSALAGDMLVILRINKDTKDITVQHLDGRNIVNPFGVEDRSKIARKGGSVSDGVEFDKKGREVAYYVRQDNYFRAGVSTRLNKKVRTERIPAVGQSGRLIAFRVSRNNQRVGSPRGKPVLSPILQNIEIGRQYKLAELQAAQVNAMFAATIEHDENSSGQNPFQKLPNGSGRHGGQTPEMAGGWSEDSGDELAGRMAQATNGIITNLGRGQKLHSHDSKRPNVSGIEFLNNLNVDNSAAVGIPSEVARMLFGNSYSASRASLEMFKIIIAFERKQFSDQYYSKIASARLRLRSLQGRIPMPKAYKQAVIKRDSYTLSAYETFRFTGVIVPHIDPLKEVKAAIERINAHLSTHETETENLGMGDFTANVDRLKKEEELLDAAGLNDNLETKEENPNGPAKKQESTKSNGTDRAQPRGEESQGEESTLETPEG